MLKLGGKKFEPFELNTAFAENLLMNALFVYLTTNKERLTH